jgi:phosphonate transport system substrate-binding protein
VLSLIACEPSPSAGFAGEVQGTLTLGLLPDENPRQLELRYLPLIEAIKGKTGLDVKMILPSSYLDLVELFGAGKVDVAYFGGYTFILANERYGAVPLVMRDIDTHFVSHVLVHKDNSAVQELSDLRGARFSFGSRQSTSGHIMPRFHLSTQGIIPEEFFSEIRFSGAHDETVQRVADGTVDAGVANGQIVQRMLENSVNDALPVRVIWQSPAYVNYVRAVQSAMSEETQRAIKEVFLSLSRGNKDHRRFLDAIGAAYFLPTKSSDFDNLRRAIEAVRGKAASG